MTSADPRIVFMGSSEFSIPALYALHDAGYELLVVSQPAKAQGRRLKIQSNPLAQAALELGYTIYTPPDINHPKSLAEISRFQPDYLITASYGAILKALLLNLPRRCINLHPSLLPLLRGATPIQSALLNGFTKTGVTLFEMIRKMDAGPVLMQNETEILKNENYSQLHDRLAVLAASMLLLYLQKPLDFTPHPQADEKATYCHKFSRADMQIDWLQPASVVRNQIRAFSLQPGAWTLWQGKQLKILAAEPLAQRSEFPASQLNHIIKNLGFAIACADTPLLITKVQPAGKKIMDAWAFVLGARMSPGEQFGS